MKRELSVLGIVIGLMVCSSAFAQDSAVGHPSDQLWNIITSIIGGVVLYFVNRLLKDMEKKTGITVSSTNQERLNVALDKAISYAEEQAHKALKKRVGPSSPKIDLASQFLTELSNFLGIQELTRDDAVKLIEARLGTVRSPTPKARMSLVPEPSPSPVPDNVENLPGIESGLEVAPTTAPEGVPVSSEYTEDGIASSMKT